MLIDIPKDVTAALTDYQPKPCAGPRPTPGAPKRSVSPRTLELLAECRKPLIYFGGGVLSSGAEEPLVRLAEKLDIPVCASMMGLGGFPADHRLWLGMVGMHGTLAANRAARECDLRWCAARAFPTGWRAAAPGFARMHRWCILISITRSLIKMSPAAVPGGRRP